MASDKPVASAEGAQSEEADLAKVQLPHARPGPQTRADIDQAFQELAKGERTASALEAQLSAMETKIDALLEQAEKEQQEIASSKEQSGKEETNAERSK